MFDNSLIESGRPRSGLKSFITLPVSIGLHTLVVGLSLGASMWFAEDPPEPPVPITFYPPQPPPPPPPAGPKTGSKGPEKPKPVPVKPIDIVAPTFVPDQIPKAPVALEHQSTGGEDGGVEGGLKGGVRGGVVGNEVGPTAPGGEGDPLPVGGNIKPPQILYKPDPIYPSAALKTHMEGVVILEAVITAQGTVEDAKILKSINPLLDDAAIRAVQQWRYKPATLNERAVRVYLTVTVSFHVH